MGSAETPLNAGTKSADEAPGGQGCPRSGRTADLQNLFGRNILLDLFLTDLNRPLIGKGNLN